MLSHIKIAILNLLLLSSFQTNARNTHDPATLADQLENLSISSNFSVSGFEHTETHSPKRIRGKASQQLKQLLTDFNYIVAHSLDGEIEKVIITGEKLVTPRGLIIETQRQGNHHTIQGFIKGNNSNALAVSLLIDTGADYIALPESMLEPLGMSPTQLKKISLQTANGKISAGLGHLQSITIGNEVLENISAAFLPDKALNGTKLLGMNVLGRYQITLNDSEQTMTLIKR